MDSSPNTGWVQAACGALVIARRASLGQDGPMDDARPVIGPAWTHSSGLPRHTQMFECCRRSKKEASVGSTGAGRMTGTSKEQAATGEKTAALQRNDAVDEWTVGVGLDNPRRADLLRVFEPPSSESHSTTSSQKSHQTHAGLGEGRFLAARTHCVAARNTHARCHEEKSTSHGDI